MSKTPQKRSRVSSEARRTDNRDSDSKPAIQAMEMSKHQEKRVRNIPDLSENQKNKTNQFLNTPLKRKLNDTPSTGTNSKNSRKRLFADITNQTQASSQSQFDSKEPPNFETTQKFRSIASSDHSSDLFETQNSDYDSDETIIIVNNYNKQKNKLRQTKIDEFFKNSPKFNLKKPAKTLTKKTGLLRSDSLEELLKTLLTSPTQNKSSPAEDAIVPKEGEGSFDFDAFIEDCKKFRNKSTSSPKTTTSKSNELKEVHYKGMSIFVNKLQKPEHNTQELTKSLKGHSWKVVKSTDLLELPSTSKAQPQQGGRKFIWNIPNTNKEQNDLVQKNIQRAKGHIEDKKVVSWENQYKTLPSSKENEASSKKHLLNEQESPDIPPRCTTQPQLGRRKFIWNIPDKNRQRDENIHTPLQDDRKVIISSNKNADISPPMSTGKNKRIVTFAMVHETCGEKYLPTQQRGHNVSPVSQNPTTSKESDVTFNTTTPSKIFKISETLPGSVKDAKRDRSNKQRKNPKFKIDHMEETATSTYPFHDEPIAKPLESRNQVVHSADKFQDTKAVFKESQFVPKTGGEIRAICQLDNEDEDCSSDVTALDDLPIEPHVDDVVLQSSGADAVIDEHSAIVDKEFFESLFRPTPKKSTKTKEQEFIDSLCTPNQGRRHLADKAWLKIQLDKENKKPSNHPPVNKKSDRTNTSPNPDEVSNAKSSPVNQEVLANKYTEDNTNEILDENLVKLTNCYNEKVVLGTVFELSNLESSGKVKPHEIMAQVITQIVPNQTGREPKTRTGVKYPVVKQNKDPVKHEIITQRGIAKKNNYIKRYQKDDQRRCKIKSTESDTVSVTSWKKLDAQEFFSTNCNIRDPAEYQRKISAVLQDQNLALNKCKPVTLIQTYNKEEILNAIKNMLSRIHKALEGGLVPVYKFTRRCSENCFMENDVLVSKPFEQAAKTSISFDKRYRTFNLMAYILTRVISLLEENKRLTKREIYYEIKHLVKNQNCIYRVIDHVCSLLNVGPWDLNITSSRGLVYGDLTIVTASEQVLDCSIGGTLIPSNLDDVTRMDSKATFILIVEKESVFQKLIDEDILNKLSRSLILITGKGYPDINTKLFACKLWKSLLVPVFILVDADLDGIRIMMSYRFGTKNHSHLGEYLAIPTAKWLGFYPSDIPKYDVCCSETTQRDRKLATNLRQHNILKTFPKIAHQVDVLLETGRKASLESLIKVNCFLSNTFIPARFISNDFI